MASTNVLWEGRVQGDSHGDPVGARLRFRPSIAGAALRADLLAPLAPPPPPAAAAAQQSPAEARDAQERRAEAAQREALRSMLHVPGLQAPQQALTGEQCRQQAPTLLAVSDVHGVVAYAWRGAGA